MFHPLVRLVFSAFSFMYGGYILYYSYSDIEGWLFLFAGTALVWGYYRYGTVWRAWKHYVNQDFDKLEKQLSYIKKPELLNPQNKAYFHLLTGVVLSQKERWKEALDHYKLASTGPLRTENVMSSVYVYLADVSFLLKDQTSAIHYLNKAKELEHSDGVSKMIRELEQRISST